MRREKTGSFLTSASASVSISMRMVTTLSGPAYCRYAHGCGCRSQVCQRCPTPAWVTDLPRLPQCRDDPLWRVSSPAHPDLLAESSDQHRIVTSDTVSFQGVTSTGSHPQEKPGRGQVGRARNPPPNCRRLGGGTSSLPWDGPWSSEFCGGRIIKATTQLPTVPLDALRPGMHVIRDGIVETISGVGTIEPRCGGRAVVP